MPDPRSPDEDKRSVDRQEAERLYLEARGDIKLVDIAKMLGRTDSMIRKWKSKDNWDGKLNPSDKKGKKKQGERSTAKKGERTTKNKEGNAPRKRGAPKGSKNALGNKGNPNPVKPLKHGGFSKHYWDGLDEEEQALIEEMSTDPEVMLMDTIKVCTLRERKLRMAIAEYEKTKLYVASVATQKTQRKFKDEEEEAQYQRMIQQKIDKGDRLPGEAEEITTITQSTIDLISRLQRELTSVSNQKAKAIESLHKMQTDNENTGDADTLKIWAENIKIMRKKGGDKND